MSGVLMRWVMAMSRDEIPDPQGRSVLVALAWKCKGKPVFASVGYLAEHTSLDARTVRAALAWLEQHGFIRATGKLHRNMRFYELKPLTDLSWINSSGPLTEASGVDGVQPLTETSVVEAADPSHSCKRPLTFLQPTPDKNVPRKSLINIEKEVAPAGIQERCATAAPVTVEHECGNTISRNAVREMREVVRRGGK